MVEPKKFVNELVVNEEFVSYFFVPETPQVRKLKKDRDYLCLKLQDKTGTMDARLWEIPTSLDPTTLKQGSFVKVQGCVTEWQGNEQITVNKMRHVEDGDMLDLGDYFERSTREPIEMYNELIGLLFGDRGLRNEHVRALMKNILDENRRNFMAAPAAKSHHHNYIGGLLEHVLSLCKTAAALALLYSLNIDLMLSACVLHDIGKLEELSYDMGISYTVAGSLIGHISMGMLLVSKHIAAIEGFPQDYKVAILHLIASHHGLLAWGSPKVPMMREAIAFHVCDLLDSRIAICNRALKEGIDESGMTKWVSELEGPLWRGPWQEDK